MLLISVLYIAVMIVIRVPNAVNTAIEKAVKMNKGFTTEYTACEIQFEAGKYNEASSCFAKMLLKYDRSDVRYAYAAALANSGEYEHAKGELLYIIKNEKKYTQIVDNSKDLMKQIDETLNKIELLKKYQNSKEQTKRLDVGNYYTDLVDTVRWKNPKNIKVYIGEDAKKDLFKKAFEHWDKNLYSMVDFVFVENKESADIACSYVDKFAGSEGGYTNWTYIKKDGRKYFDKAEISVAKHSSYDNTKFSDEQIYSIILHEIGHSLGINGHSKSKGDIMYFSTEGYLNETGMISKRDVNTVRKIYGNI